MEQIDTSPEGLVSLPTLEDLRVPEEIVEAAEEIVCTYDSSGVEPERLRLLVRFLALHLSKEWSLELGDSALSRNLDTI